MRRRGLRRSDRHRSHHPALDLRPHRRLRALRRDLCPHASRPDPDPRPGGGHARRDDHGRPHLSVRWHVWSRRGRRAGRLGRRRGLLRHRRVTFGLVAVAAFALHTRPERQRAHHRAVSRRRKRDFAFCATHRSSWPRWVLDFLANFFGASTTLMPIFAADILGGGPHTLGWLLSAPAVGSVAGATLHGQPAAAAAPRPRHPGRHRRLRAQPDCLRPQPRSLALPRLSRRQRRRRFGQRFPAPHPAQPRSPPIGSAAGSPRRTTPLPAAVHSSASSQAGIVASWTSAPAAVAIGGLGTVFAALAVWRWVPGLGTSFRWDDRNAAARVRPDSRRTPIFGGQIY